MSVSDALHDWEQLATAAFELRTMREKVREMEAIHDGARAEFENGLDELDEEEREAILSIMAIYDQCPQNDPSSEHASANSCAKTSPLSWLVNKIGNEGSEGAAWGDVLDAWAGQFPNAATSTLLGVLHQRKELFTKTGLGRKAVLRLTTKGQAMFRDGE
jgi:hypothetical protein